MNTSNWLNRRVTLCLIGIPAAWLSLVSLAHATDYHISTQADFDTYREATFSPGDNVLFESGKVFTGMFAPTAVGAPGQVITISTFGDGAKPVINNNGVIHPHPVRAGATVSAGILLFNAEYVELRGLEVTNNNGGDQPEALIGIYVLAEDTGRIHNHVYIEDNYVHHVNGATAGKQRGGIHVHGYSPTTSSTATYNDVRIVNNTIDHVGGVGIGTDIDDLADAHTFIGDHRPNAMTNLYVAHNWVGNTGRNSVIARDSDYAVYEYNTSANSSRHDTGNSFFNFRTLGIVFQYNEAYGNTGEVDDIDRGGFDADYNSRDTIFQYNYSHSNHWFASIMKKQNANVIYRYNLSVNDRYGVYHYGFESATDARNIKIYNNTHYFKEGSSPEIIGPKLGRTPLETVFNNNIYFSESPGAMGVNAENGQNVTYDTNVYYNVAPPASETNALTADPMFVEVGAEPYDVDMENGRNVLAGYRLSSRSPYLGNGVVISDNGGQDFWGEPIPAGTAGVGVDAQSHPTGVSGSVLGTDGQALKGCLVLIGSNSGHTDADGRFAQAAASDKAGELQISCRGYAPKFVALDSEKTDLGEITLKRPNFILLLSDDQGWVQTSTQMDPDDPQTKSDFFRTPNIDSFFNEGMRFVRGYSPGTYCLPTRRAIQVSQSPLKHAFNGQPVEQWTAAYRNLASIPRVLKDADPDYRAAHFGKWDHRFDHPDPSALGYDESDGATTNREGNTGAYVDGKLDKFTARAVEDPKNIFDLTRRGSEFMEKQVEAGNPFYLQLSHYALHLSIFYRQDSYDEVENWPRGEKHYISSFASMLKDMDEGFGLLFDKVRELGIEDNTYIIYMGDNGGRPTLRVSDGESRVLRNHPLSEGKHSIYEGGIRVPFGITGPGIEPGSHTRTVVSGVDILPTLADIVDSKLELNNVDGGSIKDLVNGQSNIVSRPHPFLIFHDKSANPKSSEKNADSETALLQGDYKLIKTWKDGKQHTGELYDIRQDPGEANDLTSELPELTERLGQLMDEYIAQSGGDVTITTD